MHWLNVFGPDVAELLLRGTLGWFFFLARFRWVYDPERIPHWFNPDRRHHLEWKLCACGYGRHPLLSGFVALVEISAGVAVVIGFLTPLALLGLLCVLCFATYCTGKQKVLEQQPVDRVDCVSCYLWRVEGVYIAIAIALLLLGAGRFSLDAYMGVPL